MPEPGAGRPLRRPLIEALWMSLGLIVAVVLALAFALPSCFEREPGAASPAPQAKPAAEPAPAETPQVVQAVAVAPAVRDPRWAVPISKPGLFNLHKVSDALYRSAQPTAEGFREAAAMGIKTVVNLRSFHSDRDEMGDLEFNYEHITMKAWHAEDKEIVRFLRIVGDAANQPVLVHCQHGADRTGTMCAVYRMAVQGWSVEDAIEEMAQGGYGYHDVFDKTLLDYLRGLDVEAMKAEAEGRGAKDEG